MKQEMLCAVRYVAMCWASLPWA